MHKLKVLGCIPVQFLQASVFINSANYVNLLTRFDLSNKDMDLFHTLRFKYASQSCMG